MTSRTLSKLFAVVCGAFIFCNAAGQVVSEFTDWEVYAGGKINQGPDGPCEYIARSWAVEYAIRMYFKESGTTNSMPDIDLSEQHIYQRCFQRLPEYSNCTTPESITGLCMADFISNHGIANEACLPAPVVGGISQYDRNLLSTSNCVNPCNGKPSSSQYVFRAPLDYANYDYQMGINNNTDLKKSIIKYGPHSLYFLDGEYVNSEHAILIVGWNSSGEWRFKNSSELYFDGRGISGIGTLAFDISQYTSVKVGRVTGAPVCQGSGCNAFARRALDSDGDGFCSIKWGDLPAGISCKGHDADDSNSAVGPYTDYGYKTRLVAGSTVTLDSAQTDPMIVRANSKVILAPGFSYTARNGGRTFTAFIGDSY